MKKEDIALTSYLSLSGGIDSFSEFECYYNGADNMQAGDQIPDNIEILGLDVDFAQPDLATYSKSRGAMKRFYNSEIFCDKKLYLEQHGYIKRWTLKCESVYQKLPLEVVEKCNIQNI